MCFIKESISNFQIYFFASLLFNIQLKLLQGGSRWCLGVEFVIAKEQVFDIKDPFPPDVIPFPCKPVACDSHIHTRRPSSTPVR